MFSRSLVLLASAGAAVAQLAPECEHVTDVAALLQAEDGKTYCSSILSLGTVTDTVVESATATETTTITTPSQITLTMTTTQTDTVSSGTVTETAPVFTETSTVVEETTVYNCATLIVPRALGAQSTPCAKGKTTSTPTPTSTPCTKTSATPTPVKTSTPCKSSQKATPVYGASQIPAHSQPAALSAQYYAPGSSQAAYPSLPVYGESESASVPAYGAFSSQLYSVSSVEAYPLTSSIYEIISSSEIYTPSPTPTPTPTPTPSCDTAPTAVRTGYACDIISTACGCLGLASATEHVTTTTTLSETAFVTEAMLFTTTTQLTETIFTTVPAATETITPSVTVTTTATATATVCPCSGSTSTLCGATADTCKDLQNDPQNCGACGNSCGSGICSAGKCMQCVPRTCSTLSLGPCKAGTACYCVTGTAGTPMCADLSRQACNRFAQCDTDANCGAGEICTRSTCCSQPSGKGICVSANTCGNSASTKRMFEPRGKGAMGRNEVLGQW